MSYSFTVTADTKEEATRQIRLIGRQPFSLGWKHDIPQEFISANLSVNVQFRNKPKGG